MKRYQFEAIERAAHDSEAEVLIVKVENEIIKMEFKYVEICPNDLIYFVDENGSETFLDVERVIWVKF